MCGIAGVLARTGPLPDGLIEDMTASLVHRGPDGEGFYRDDRIHLGMRRLAIMDLEHGQQPLFNERRNLVVVFNGEIYNHAELRADLVKKGHKLTSETDGAVLPHLFEEFGERFVEKLNGIFAIALWDLDARRLYLARDPFGVKPLYWSKASGRLSFCSEIRGLLRDPLIPRDVDIRGVDDFLTFRFIPAPRSPFLSISKVPPGSLLVATQDGELAQRYWDGDMTSVRSDVPALVDEYRACLEAAVVRQMMSDRPIGVMLSGGVDSALITAIMAERSAQVRTFTIGFEGGGTESDETELAAATARLFGTQHESMVVPTSDYLDRVPESYRLLEEPVGSSSALAVNYVASMMGEQVPVALCGQGVDELMGGYWRYLGAKFAPVLGPIAPPLRLLQRFLPGGRVGVRIRRGISTVAGVGDLSRLMAAYYLTEPVERKALYDAAVVDQLADHSPEAPVEALCRNVSGLPLLDQMLYVDARLWLPSELLLIADKMSMAASVELRVPFLDPGVAALAESMSGAVKVRRFQRKYLHKRAAERWLPHEIVHRRERGWATPMGAWLRNELKEPLRDTLLGEGTLCRRLFRPDTVETLLDQHLRKERDRTRELFALLSLGLWHEHFASTPAT